MNGKKPLQTDKLFNRQYITMCLLAIIFFFGECILITSIPLFTLKLGGTEAAAGLFMSVVSLAALVVRPLMGRLMDTRSRRLVLLIGTAALSAASLSYSFAASIPLLLALASVHGIALSAVTTSGPAVVADVTPAARLEEGVSLYGITLSLTQGLGPLTALFLLSRFSYSKTFIFTFFFIVLSVLLAFFLNYEKRKENSERSGVQARPGGVKILNIKNLFEINVLKPALYQFLMTFSMSMIVTFIPIFGNVRKIGDIGLFYLLYSCSSVFISLFAGRLVRKYGTGRMIITGFVLQFAAFFTLAFSYSLAPIAAAAVLYGLGSGCSFVALNIIVIKSAPKGRLGASNATVYAAMDIGIASGSCVLGFISAQFGFSAAFLVTAAVILADFLLFAALNRKAAPEVRSTQE